VPKYAGIAITILVIRDLFQHTIIVGDILNIMPVMIAWRVYEKCETCFSQEE